MDFISVLAESSEGILEALYLGDMYSLPPSLYSAPSMITHFTVSRDNALLFVWISWQPLLHLNSHSRTLETGEIILSLILQHNTERTSYHKPGTISAASLNLHMPLCLVLLRAPSASCSSNNVFGQCGRANLHNHRRAPGGRCVDTCSRVGIWPRLKLLQSYLL